MGDFGSIDWKHFDTFLLARGCIFKRMKGDHRIYWKNGIKRPIIVPQYDPLPPFIVLNNLKIIGATKKDLLLFLGRI
jgi:predicted RNA binding protein YcfA (HicA-like mRNA interferase family)